MCVKECALPLVEDVEIDGALIAYSNNFFVQKSSASPWFAASCCCDGSLSVTQTLWVQETSEVPPMSEGVAATHTCARHRAMPAPVLEGIAAQLTHLNHPHVAAFILFLLITYVRPTELRALRKKDLVPPLVALLPRWSVAIATSETGVSTKTGVELSAVSQDTTRAVAWRPTTRPLRNGLETLARRGMVV